MNTLRKPPAHRPSRLVTALVALGAGLAAMLVVSGCYAFNRVVLGDGLGFAAPALVVRIASAVLGTGTAALVVALAFRLVDGPVPGDEDKLSPPPSAGKTLPRWHEPGKDQSNGNRATYARGKEELPWT
jgi:hypothetical protein